MAEKKSHAHAQGAQAPQPIVQKITDRPLERELHTSYIDYAMSVIVGRALPDVRDGFKPVHRRILFGMYELSNTHDKPYKKSARIVGEVMGKYHPHGDTAIYDTIVRMAQEFSMRHPLVDGQGNFGCFTIDTKVRLADGRSISFGELVEEHKLGKRNFAYTVDEKGRIGMDEIKNPRMTISKAELLKVTLDNGTEIRCTPNHRFMTLAGGYCEAQCLKPGDSLMPLYSKLSGGEDNPKLAGYEMVYQPSSTSWDYAHHIADEWNISHSIYARAAGRIRHHKDFQKLNNSPSNIVRMHWKEHWKTHYDLTSQKHLNDAEYRAKLAEGRQKYWNSENRKKRSELTSKRNSANWKTPKYKAHMKAKLSEISTKYVEMHPEVRIESSKRLTRTLKGLWQNAEYRETMHARIIKGNKNHKTNKTGKLKFMGVCRRISERGLIVSEENYEKMRNVVYPYGRATSWKTGLANYFGGNAELVLKELNGNHKVIKVEKLPEREDVYDLTIENKHNFALAAGVFVHNSVDGDSPAAMRYTEVRLHKLSDELLADIDKETVDFTPNFDGTLKEPACLPAKFPNLLVNGSSGIAVGMATNIPPHNLGEAIDGVVALIDKPDVETATLCSIIRGPDFPTGGIIIGRAGILDAYANGRGTVRVRGRAEITDSKKEKGRKVIRITELPYQVNKAELVKTIAELARDKKIEGIADIQDLSNKDGMEVRIELKRDANPEVVLNLLYAKTQLENTFGIISIALVNNEPKVLNLRQMLTHFLSHRQTIVRRRCTFDLNVAKERKHILEGLKIALANIDAIIAAIKKSADAPTAKATLMSSYSLSEKQAVAILDTKLQRLTSLERHKIDEEDAQLAKTIEGLASILADEKKILAIIKSELLEIKSKYANARRTEIQEGADEEFELEDLIPDEPVAIVITENDYIKRMPLSEYKAQRRGGRGILGAEVREEDRVKDIIIARTHDTLLFFTNAGIAHWLKAHRIPSSGRYSGGKPIVNLLDVQNERIASWIPVREFKADEYLVMVTKKGTIKRTSLENFARPRKGGIIAITLREGDSLVEARKTDGKQQIIIATKNGQSIRFDENEAREIGRTGQGVRGIDVADDDEVVGFALCRNPTVLTITENGYGKRTPLEEYRLQGRSGSGIINIKTEGRNGHVIGVKTVSDEDEILLISSGNKVIRISVKDISVIGRNTQGVRIMKLDEGEKVIAFEHFTPENGENGNGHAKTEETKTI